jgi:hypothetical protein
MFSLVVLLIAFEEVLSSTMSVSGACSGDLVRRGCRDNAQRTRCLCSADSERVVQHCRVAEAWLTRDVAQRDAAMWSEPNTWQAPASADSALLPTLASAVAVHRTLMIVAASHGSARSIALSRQNGGRLLLARRAAVRLLRIDDPPVPASFCAEYAAKRLLDAQLASLNGAIDVVDTNATAAVADALEEVAALTANVPALAELRDAAQTMLRARLASDGQRRAFDFFGVDDSAIGSLQWTAYKDVVRAYSTALKSINRRVEFVRGMVQSQLVVESGVATVMHALQMTRADVLQGIRVGTAAVINELGSLSRTVQAGFANVSTSVGALRSDLTQFRNDVAQGLGALGKQISENRDLLLQQQAVINQTLSVVLENVALTREIRNVTLASQTQLQLLQDDVFSLQARVALVNDSGGTNPWASAGPMDDVDKLQEAFDRGSLPAEVRADARLFLTLARPQTTFYVNAITTTATKDMLARAAGDRVIVANVVIEARTRQVQIPVSVTLNLRANSVFSADAEVLVRNGTSTTSLPSSRWRTRVFFSGSARGVPGSWAVLRLSARGVLSGFVEFGNGAPFLELFTHSSGAIRARPATKLPYFQFGNLTDAIEPTTTERLRSTDNNADRKRKLSGVQAGVLRYRVTTDSYVFERAAEKTTGKRYDDVVDRIVADVALLSTTTSQLLDISIAVSLQISSLEIVTDASGDWSRDEHDPGSKAFLYKFAAFEKRRVRAATAPSFSFTMLVSGRSGREGGGIAFMSGLINGNPFGTTAFGANYADASGLAAFAHEVGHILGASHTHDIGVDECVLAGGNGDNAQTKFLPAVGQRSCQKTDLTDSACGPGTIMSYCTIIDANALSVSYGGFILNRDRGASLTAVAPFRWGLKPERTVETMRQTVAASAGVEPLEDAIDCGSRIAGCLVCGPGCEQLTKLQTKCTGFLGSHCRVKEVTVPFKDQHLCKYDKDGDGLVCAHELMRTPPPTPAPAKINSACDRKSTKREAKRGLLKISAPKISLSSIGAKLPSIPGLSNLAKAAVGVAVGRVTAPKIGLQMPRVPVSSSSMAAAVTSMFRNDAFRGLWCKLGATFKRSSDVGDGDLLDSEDHAALALVDNLGDTDSDEGMFQSMSGDDQRALQDALADQLRSAGSGSISERESSLAARQMLTVTASAQEARVKRARVSVALAAQRAFEGSTNEFAAAVFDSNSLIDIDVLLRLQRLLQFNADAIALTTLQQLLQQRRQLRALTLSEPPLPAFYRNSFESNLDLAIAEMERHYNDFKGDSMTAQKGVDGTSFAPTESIVLYRVPAAAFGAQRDSFALNGKLSFELKRVLNDTTHRRVAVRDWRVVLDAPALAGKTVRVTISKGVTSEFVDIDDSVHMFTHATRDRVRSYDGDCRDTASTAPLAASDFFEFSPFGAWTVQVDKDVIAALPGPPAVVLVLSLKWWSSVGAAGTSAMFADDDLAAERAVPVAAVAAECWNRCPFSSGCTVTAPPPVTGTVAVVSNASSLDANYMALMLMFAMFLR